MSICAKGVSRGVHNIAFLLSPDRFRAFDLFFLLKKGTTKNSVGRGIGGDSVRGVNQDAVASFAFYHSVFFILMELLMGDIGKTAIAILGSMVCRSQREHPDVDTNFCSI
jgi:hypothetical protein